MTLSRASLSSLRITVRAIALCAAVAAALVPLVPAGAQQPADPGLALRRERSVFVATTDGRNPKVRYQPSEGSVVADPVLWLPGGDLLVIDSTPDCTSTVRVDIEGRRSAFPYPESGGCPQDVALSPDGRFAAFASYFPPFACREARAPSCTNLAYRAIDDEQSPTYVRAGTGEPLWYVRFAPDGVTLYAIKRSFDPPVRSGSLISIDLLRNTVKTIAAEADALDVGPGGMLALQRRETIVLRSPDGTERTLGRGQKPAFAPDGKSLYVVRDGEIWSVPVGEGKATRLVEGISVVARRPYSVPAAAKPPAPMAFLREGQIWYATRDEERRVGKGDGYSSLAWSPDGERLLAVRGTSVFEVTLDGKETPFDAGHATVTSIATSAETNTLAFVAPDDKGVPSIWARGSEETAPRLIAPTDRKAGTVLSFSADGTKILATVTVPGARGKLLAFDAATGKAVDLPAVPAEGRVALAEDGTLWWSGPEPISPVRRSLLHRGDEMIATSLDDSVDPALSPDGSLLAFVRGAAGTRGESGRSTLWISAPDGTGARPVAVGAGAPLWQPGKAITTGTTSGAPAGRFLLIGLVLVIVGASAFLGLRRKPGDRTLEKMLEQGPPVDPDAEPVADYTNVELVSFCPECGAALRPSDEWCPRCGLRTLECGCVIYQGERKIVCWPHFKAENPDEVSAAD